ncbi:hypothetical protein A1O3_04600 [Capronia epimyces CBS 606.96]|uniref:Isochorismatase-like domain-containing protein n=1 Tax=Capronia epimyces CBS 606.96 TaxID=1182542 RepID=W9YZB9_9EURO|nr:uncharacterized protein A1O3_04600 [Capronia epimyces CBS 606.96]EXJ87639.1 hypothetical protein A1O3_04600 [Capronia epimyces CBS 606.96]
MGNTALLVLDIQNGIVPALENLDPYLERLAQTIKSAREADIKIIYVTTGFRPGYPEISPRNLSFVRASKEGSFVEGSTSTQVHSAVAPLEGDIIITKHRVSAFHGTDLDITLRSLNIDALVITGMASSGAVLSTVRQAANMDCSLVVLEDLCTDVRPEFHGVLLQVFEKQAQLVSSFAWEAGLVKK